MGLESLLVPFRHFIGHRANSSENLQPSTEDSPVLETPLGILEEGLLKYAIAINAVRSYHQHRSNLRYLNDPLMNGPLNVSNYNQFFDELGIAGAIKEKIKKEALGILDYRLAGLYLALMDGSGTIFDSHAEIKGIVEKGVNPDFVAGFWFLFSFGNKNF